MAITEDALYVGVGVMPVDRGEVHRALPPGLEVHRAKVGSLLFVVGLEPQEPDQCRERCGHH